MIQVQAENGAFYINPKIEGDQYYFDITDEGCIFHLLKHRNTTPKSAQERCRKAMRECGIKGKLTGESSVGKNLFPPFYDELTTSYDWNIELTGPIPTPNTAEGAVSIVDIMTPFLAWSLEFDKFDLITVFETGPINKLLVGFLTDSSPFNPDREELQEALRQTLPGLSRYKKNPVNYFKDKPNRISIESKRIRRTVAAST